MTSTTRMASTTRMMSTTRMASTTRMTSTSLRESDTPRDEFVGVWTWFFQDSGSKLKSSFKQRIRVFFPQKCFQTADSGLSLRIRGVLSSFGVLQNSGFGSFSQDSGSSFKILRVLQKFFQMDVDAFFDGCRRFFRMKSSSKMDDGCSSNSS